MPKRPGENLARTEDGAQYNKLQRPDNWPQEPARSVPSDDENDEVNEEPESDAQEQSTHAARRAKQHRSRQRRKGRNTESGCLPMDDDDFSGSENGNDVSFAAMQYLKSVR